MACIESQRINLRRFNEEDLANLIELESDPEVMRFTGPGRALPIDTIKERLAVLLKEENGDFGVWAAELLGGGDFVGWFMLRKTNLDAPELGFMLVKRQWGKGLATEACRALLAYGFKKVGLEKIVAVTNPDNLASIKVLEKSGMVFKEKITLRSSKLNKDILVNYYEAFSGP